MFDLFLWVILPYITITIFIGGLIYRYNKDQFGWTSKSSEVLEKKMLGIGSRLFHWGIIFVFGGHVMGILIPDDLYHALQISEETYHAVALGFGLPAGIATAVGLYVLIQRRLSVKRIRVTSSKGDFGSLIFLGLVVVSGLSATFMNIDSNGFDYRTTIGPWFRSIFLLQPKFELMSEVPIWFKIHILSSMSLFIIWPFTRLVHIFSMPLKYMTRSYVIYRKRDRNH